MTALPKLRQDHDSPKDLSRSAAFASRIMDAASQLEPDDAAPVLLYAELVPDSGDEIVLRPGGLDRRFRFIAPRLPIETGSALPHITAAGEDVTGLHFLRFDDGLTLYYPPDVELEFIVLEA